MHFVHTVYLCIPYGSNNKQRLFFLYGIHRLVFLNEALTEYLYTGLFEMIVGVLTTCHTQYT